MKPEDVQKMIETPSEVREAMVEVEEQMDLWDGAYTSGVSFNREILATCLQAELSGMTLEQIAGLLTNPYAELIEYAALANKNGLKGACRKLTLLYNPHRLDTRTKTSVMTLYQAIREHPTFHSGLARATIMRMRERTRPSEMAYMVFQLGVNGIQICNDYPPHVARDWCDRYRLNRDSHVLDPCAGWGGRMAGCSVRVGHYTGYEPASRTANGLHRLADFLARARGGTFDALIFCEPYEDSSEKPGFYDLAMTSPPYYDSEIYSDEPTNSLNRYLSFDAWCEGFYWPLIDKTMRQLKPDAPFIINIGDRQYPLTQRLIQHCNKMDYSYRKLRGDLVDSGGIGREMGAGEKFFELRKM